MFKIDSPFMNFLTKIADIMIVNALVLIFSLPIITAGAAVTAGYYMGFKLVKDEETYIIKGYWKSFKENFFQSTILWILIMAIAGVLYCDYKIILDSGIEFERWMKIAVLAVTVVIILGVSFVFPMQARYANKVLRTFKNAFLMALSHVPTAFLNIIIMALPVVILYYIPESVIVLIFTAVGLVIFCQSFFIMKIFAGYEEKMNESDEDAALEDDGIFAESDRIEQEAALEAKENGKKKRK